MHWTYKDRVAMGIARDYRIPKRFTCQRCLRILPMAQVAEIGNDVYRCLDCINEFQTLKRKRKNYEQR